MEQLTESPSMTLVVAALLAVLAVLVFVAWAYGEWRVRGATPEDHHPRVDPWLMQMSLMEMSRQHMPRYASITRDSVLYSALILEEAGELMEALAKVMAARLGRKQIMVAEHAFMLETIIREWRHSAAEMKNSSSALRYALKSNLTISIAELLSAEEAKDILDGHVDLTVVNCGFALANGLPGRLGYAHVWESNASKANPATGMIDKDPSGKWIKGPRYHEPQLAELMRNAGSIFGDNPVVSLRDAYDRVGVPQ